MQFSSFRRIIKKRPRPSPRHSPAFSPSFPRTRESYVADAGRGRQAKCPN